MKKAGGLAPAGLSPQNSSLNIPITTIRPMMKMIPAVPPMNFNMPFSPVFSGL